MVMSVQPMVVTPVMDLHAASPTTAPDTRNAPDSFQQPAESDRDAFAALMRTPSSTAARLEPGAPMSMPSMIEQFAATQNSDMRELLQSTRDLVKAAPNLSLSEMMAFGNETTMKVAVTTTQYNVAGNLSKSASKGVETLMRNQ